MEQSSPSAEEVRQRMQEVRRNLKPEVDNIFSSARELTDWQYYVKRFPWASLACASALGYLIVPRKLQIVRPDAKTVEHLARSNRLVVEHKPKGTERPGLIGSALQLTSNMILRAGIAYLGQQAGRLFGEQAAETSQQPVWPERR